MGRGYAGCAPHNLVCRARMRLCHGSRGLAVPCIPLPPAWLARAYAGAMPHHRAPLPARLPPQQMEVGIEDCLHIEFEYDRGAYHLTDTVLGRIHFLLVRRRGRRGGGVSSGKVLCAAASPAFLLVASARYKSCCTRSCRLPRLLIQPVKPSPILSTLPSRCASS